MYEDYLDLFINYLESSNKSEVTISQYKRELEKFFEFLTGKGVLDVKDIETIHIDLYQGNLMKINKSVVISTHSNGWFIPRCGLSINKTLRERCIRATNRAFAVFHRYFIRNR